MYNGCVSINLLRKELIPSGVTTREYEVFSSSFAKQHYDEP